jgi:hypothetical protein
VKNKKKLRLFEASFDFLMVILLLPMIIQKELERIAPNQELII